MGGFWLYRNSCEFRINGRSSQLTDAYSVRLDVTTSSTLFEQELEAYAKYHAGSAKKFVIDPTEILKK